MYQPAILSRGCIGMSEAEYWESLLGRGAGDPDIYGYPDEDKIVLGS